MALVNQIKIDLESRIQAVHSDAHGRMDRIESQQKAEHDDMKSTLKVISDNTQSIMLSQERLTQTGEFLAVNVRNNTSDIDRLKISHQKAEIDNAKSNTRNSLVISAVIAVTMVLLAGFINWTFQSLSDQLATASQAVVQAEKAN